MKKIILIFLSVFLYMGVFGQSWTTGISRPSTAVPLQTPNNPTFYINQSDTVVWIRLGSMGDLPLTGHTTGGGGSSYFTGLLDTPNSYTSYGGNIITVNSTETGVEFTPTGDLTESIVGMSFSTTRKVIGGSTNLTLDPGYLIPTAADTLRWFNGNYILNQFSTDQVANFRINGTGRVNNLSLNSTYSPTGSEPTGYMYWDSQNHTISSVLENGTIGQHFEESFILGQNDTGATLTDGTVVAYSSAIGASGNIRIKKALASSTEEPFMNIGVLTDPVLNGDVGYITVFGKVRGIETDGVNYGETWSNGDILYVSSTIAGGLTNIPPNAPIPAIPIAVVINVHHTDGTILVRPTFPTKMVDLADVNGTPLTTTGQFPVWHNDTQVFDFDYNINNYWNKSEITTTDTANWNLSYRNRIISLTTIGNSGAATLSANVLNIPNYTLSGLGGVPNTRTITINGSTLDLSADRTWSLDLSGSGATLSGYTISLTGDATPVTLPAEADGSITNEGILGIGAGTSTSSIITSNTSTAAGVTINVGTGLGITETTSSNGGSITLINTSPDQVIAITGAGITNVTGTYPNFTVTSTEVDGSITNEGLLTVAGTTNNAALSSNTSGSNVINFKGAGDNTVSVVGNDVTITGTDNQTLSTTGAAGNISISGGNTITLNVNDADSNPTNEAQTFSATGTTNPTLNVSQVSGVGGGTVTIQGGGTTSVTNSGGTITIYSSAPASNVVNAYSNKLTVTTDSIYANWPTNFGNINYFLYINAYYDEIINGKTVRIKNAIYNFHKSLSGFNLKLDTIAGYVEYFAADTTNLYPLAFNNYVAVADSTLSTGYITHHQLNTSAILNQNTSPQPANFWISGSGTLNGVLQINNSSPYLDFFQPGIRSWHIGQLTSGSSDFLIEAVGSGITALKLGAAGDAIFPSTIQATTAKLTNLMDGYLPYSTASGLADSPVYTSSGNVGIGTNSPNDKLTVDGNISIYGNRLYNGAGSNSAGIDFSGAYTNLHGFYGIVFYSSNAAIGSMSERMRITSSGNVGIGTVSPDKLLTVNGEMKATTATFTGVGTATGVSNLGLDASGNLTTNISGGGGGMTLADFSQYQQGSAMLSINASTTIGYGLFSLSNHSASTVATHLYSDNGPYFTLNTTTGSNAYAYWYGTSQRIYQPNNHETLEITFSTSTTTSIDVCIGTSYYYNSVFSGSFAALGLSCINGTDTNYQFYACDGTSTTKVDTGIALSTSVYKFVLDQTSDTSVSYYLYDAGGTLLASTTITTNIPSPTTQMYPAVAIVRNTLTSTAKNINFYNAKVFYKH